MLAPALASGGVTDTVISGPFLLAGLLAIAAGVVSFASPCVVPLVPGYLSYLAGLVGAEAAGGSGAGTPGVGSGAGSGLPAPGSGAAGAALATRSRVRWRAVGATGLFVAGFSLVFLAESALALGVYTTLIRNQELLMRVSGVIAIVMGLVLAGAVPLLQREWRFHLRPGGAAARSGGTGSGRSGAGKRSRIWGAPVLGAAFGTGWLACTSPTLAGILALSSATEWNGNAVRGLLLVLLYCAGLGVPFVMLAIGFGWAGTALAFLRRHARGIQLGGAAVLMLIGVLMVTGAWGAVLSRLQGAAVLL